eukprot:scaffold154277_cov27-Tisochrysis_lutea.AAC.2
MTSARSSPSCAVFASSNASSRTPPPPPAPLAPPADTTSVAPPEGGLARCCFGIWSSGMLFSRNNRSARCASEPPHFRPRRASSFLSRSRP